MIAIDTALAHGARALDAIVERELLALEAAIRTDLAAAAFDTGPAPGTLDPEQWQRLSVDDVLAAERQRLVAWRDDALAALRQMLLDELKG